MSIHVQFGFNYVYGFQEKAFIHVPIPSYAKLHLVQTIHISGNQMAFLSLAAMLNFGLTSK